MSWFRGVSYEERIQAVKEEKVSLAKDIDGSIEGTRTVIEELIKDKARLINLLDEVSKA